jgi:hypothetical protein
MCYSCTGVNPTQQPPRRNNHQVPITKDHLITVTNLRPLGSKQLVTCPLDPAKLVFQEFTGTLTDDDRKVYVDMEIHVGGEECHVIQIQVKSHAGGHVPIKRLPLEHYVRALVGYMLFEGDPDGVAQGNLHRHGWRRDTDARLARLTKVAEWYREAQEQGVPTGKYVAVRAGVQPNHVRRLVMNARDAGLLEPNTDNRGKVRP